MSFSKYPNSLDDSSTLPPSTDLVTPVKAEVTNRLRDSILSTQSELGTTPSGTFGTVRARLDDVDSTLTNIQSDMVKGSGVDNTIAKWDGEKDIQGTGIVIDDSDNISGLNIVTVDNFLSSPLVTVGNELILEEDGYITILNSLSDPAVNVNGGSIYTKDISGIVELFYLDGYGQAVQITSDGYLDTSNLDLDSSFNDILINDEGFIRINNSSIDPTDIPNSGSIYTKIVSGITELFYKDDSGTVIQITSDGYLTSDNNTFANDLNDHITNPSGAHAATAISSTLITGTSLSLPAGSVQSQLTEIADEAAGLASNNIFSGTNSFSGTNVNFTNVSAELQFSSNNSNGGTNAITVGGGSGTTGRNLRLAAGNAGSTGGIGGNLRLEVGAENGSGNAGQTGRFIEDHTSDVNNKTRIVERFFTPVAEPPNAGGNVTLYTYDTSNLPNNSVTTFDVLFHSWESGSGDTGFCVERTSFSIHIDNTGSVTPGGTELEITARQVNGGNTGAPTFSVGTSSTNVLIQASGQDMFGDDEWYIQAYVQVVSTQFNSTPDVT